MLQYYYLRMQYYMLYEFKHSINNARNHYLEIQYMQEHKNMKRKLYFFRPYLLFFVPNSSQSAHLLATTKIGLRPSNKQTKL